MFQPKSLSRTTLFRTGRALAVICLALMSSGCSLGYYARGAWNGYQILRTRQDLVEVATDADLDERSRRRLVLVREATQFARDSLGFDVGGTYSSVVFLPSDTLAHVVSAAPPDRLEPYLWKFPFVGALPYKGFFSLAQAQEEEARLARDGLDTYLRPTGAFSTLGWLEDPLPANLLARDEVSLIETVFHELSHQELFLSGQVRFNESFATWVGHAAAITFFCGRPGGGPDTVWCGRARDRWADAQRFSAFLDPLITELEALYADSSLSREEKIIAREPVFAAALRTFDETVRPELNASSFSGFRSTPLNNATLLARIRYYHRLPDFAAFHAVCTGGEAGWDSPTRLGERIRSLRATTVGVQDPFAALTCPPTQAGVPPA